MTNCPQLKWKWWMVTSELICIKTKARWLAQPLQKLTFLITYLYFIHFPRICQAFSLAIYAYSVYNIWYLEVIYHETSLPGNFYTLCKKRRIHPGLWHFVCPLIFTIPYTTALWGLFFCQIFVFSLYSFVLLWYNRYIYLYFL